LALYRSVAGGALCLVFFGLSSPAGAQQKLPLVGVLSPGSGAPDNYSQLVEAFRDGLLQLGYESDKNIRFEYRFAAGNLAQMPALVNELLQTKPDVIVVSAVPAIRAAKQITKTVPIVMISTVDPVAAGIVESLAHPGGNITGLALLTRDLSAKRLEILTEVLRKILRIAVLWDKDGPGPAIAFDEYKAVAPSMNLQLQSLEVRGPAPDLNGTFQAATKGRPQALLAIRNPLLARYVKEIASLAIERNLPSMCEEGLYADAGCLLSYAASDSDRWRRAAVYVDKILKGAKPTDLPVEQPTKFELVINLKTAKQIGLTIPPSVLARADRVIR
jgi:putative ABC transport system substrate-binding protein